MRSHNVVLTVCLVFITIMLSGLCAQSCRSSKQQHKTNYELDSTAVNESENSKYADSVFRFLQKARLNWAWTTEKYAPVFDSEGQRVGSVLDERTTFNAQSETEQETSGSRQEYEGQKQNSSSDVKKKLDEEGSKEVKSNSNFKSGFIIGFLVVLSCFIIWRFRKKIFRIN